MVGDASGGRCRDGAGAGGLAGVISAPGVIAFIQSVYAAVSVWLAALAHLASAGRTNSGELFDR